MFNFQHPSMLAAARAHVDSLRWRLGVWGVLALGAALVLNSFAAGAAWFLAVALATGFDALLGHSYLAVRSAKEQSTTGALFVGGCAFSSVMFTAMPLYLVAEGGGPGRVLGVLMAASAFVRVMLFLSRARAFMIVAGLPATACLLIMPFVPVHAGSATGLLGTLGVGCGVVAFLAYVWRAAVNHNSMIARLEAAHQRAKEGRREAEAKRAEAEQANRAKSEFLSIVTHELRTPLNAVIGYAEILNEDLADRPEAARDARSIEASARHLLGLIEQILSMTSADAAFVAHTPRQVEVRQALEAQVAALQAELEASGNRVSVWVGPGAERAELDAAKLDSCVAVLISNAVKFTDHGLIAVKAERIDSAGAAWLAISVSDTGVGIAREDFERIFTPFVQAESTATRVKGGVGLGLAIARRAAQSMRGELDVVSELGGGSTFTLRLPLTPGSANETRAAA